MPRYYRRNNSDEKKSDKYKFDWFGNNRHICDVLSDMRKCQESLNYSALKGLIEEVQIMANRMESALSDQKDLKKLNIELSKARKAYKELQVKYEVLEAKVKLKTPPKNNKG